MEEIKELKESAERMISEKQKLEEDLKETKNKEDVKEKNKQLKTLSEEIAKIEKDIMENLNEQYIKLKGSMNEKIAGKEPLENELKEAKNELKEAENELKQLGITKENYKGKTDIEKRQWKEINGKIEKTKNKIKKKENELVRLLKEIDGIDKNTKELKDSLLEMYPEIKEYVGKLTQKEEERLEEQKIEEKQKEKSKLEEKKKSLEEKKEKVAIFKEFYNSHLRVKADVKKIVANMKKISQLGEERLKAIGKSDEYMKLLDEDVALKMENSNITSKICGIIESNGVKLTREDVENILKNSKKFIKNNDELTLDEIMDKNIAKLDKSIAGYDRKLEKIASENEAAKNVDVPKDEEAYNVVDNTATAVNTGVKANTESEKGSVLIEKNETQLQKATWYSKIGNSFKKMAEVLRHPIRAIKNRLSRGDDDIEFVEEPLEGEPKETEIKVETITGEKETAEPKVEVLEAEQKEGQADIKLNMNASKFRDALKYDIVKDVSKELSGGKLNLKIKPKDQSKDGNAR